MHRPFACAAIVLAFSAGSASALISDFDYTYDGATLTQDAGSDTAAGTSLAVGDGFTATVSAEGTGFWTVTTPLTGLFVYLGYVTVESATRTADVVTTFSLGGATALVIEELGVTQEFVHAGSQLWDLPGGLMFDQVEVSYELLDDGGVGTTLATDGGEILADFSNSQRPFYNHSSIVYASDAAVPLPAALPLAAAGLAALGLVARRRRS